MYQRLVRYTHLQRAGAVYQYALATQPRVYPRISGAVYKVFLPVCYFRYILIAALQVYVAGAASTHHATVVMQFYVIIKCYFQDTLVRGNVFESYRFKPFLVKSEFYCIHERNCVVNIRQQS